MARKPTKNSNSWKMNNTFLNDQRIIKEIRQQMKEFLD
jgi:hypothetical protein